MAEIINFNKFLLGKRTRDAFKDWNNRFGCSLKDTTRIRDLPNHLLLALAEGGSEGNTLLDNVILKVWGIDKGSILELPSPIKLKLLDLSLFLMDQLRFECMFRLGWISPLKVREIPILDLLLSEQEEYKTYRTIPRPNTNHPHYSRVQPMLEIEKEIFIRQQIPVVLDQFRRFIRHKR